MRRVCWKTIKAIVSIEIQTLGLPNLKIGISPEAVEHNMTILEQNKFNLRQVIDINAQTSKKYGSEFQPTQILEKVMGEHRFWKRTKKNL